MFKSKYQKANKPRNSISNGDLAVDKSQSGFYVLYLFGIWPLLSPPGSPDTPGPSPLDPAHSPLQAGNALPSPTSPPVLHCAAREDFANTSNQVLSPLFFRGSQDKRRKLSMTSSSPCGPAQATPAPLCSMLSGLGAHSPSLWASAHGHGLSPEDSSPPSLQN